MVTHEGYVFFVITVITLIKYEGIACPRSYPLGQWIFVKNTEDMLQQVLVAIKYDYFRSYLW